MEMLTVHGAKGLEFDQVFLPFLDWQPLKSEDKTPPFLLEEIPGTPAPRPGPGPALYPGKAELPLPAAAESEGPPRPGGSPAGLLCGRHPGPAAPGAVRVVKQNKKGNWQLRRQPPGVALAALPAGPAAGGVP